jgi:hypothetical protein
MSITITFEQMIAAEAAQAKTVPYRTIDSREEWAKEGTPDHGTTLRYDRCPAGNNKKSTTVDGRYRECTKCHAVYGEGTWATLIAW